MSNRDSRHSTGPQAIRSPQGFVRGRRAISALFVACIGVLAAWCALVGTAAEARAAGTVTLTDGSPKEDGGRWKLKMTINYGSVPPVAIVPMVFTFTHVTQYELSLTDQSPKTPVLTKRPLQGQTPSAESMDVYFSDVGTGKVFAMTKHDFVLRRDNGYEAGEYSLTIKRAGDGVQVGSTMKITLQGDNPIVDRRAIVFTGEPKKDKKPGDAAQGEGPSGDGSTGSGNANASPGEGSGETGAGAGSAGDVPPVETPPAVEPKQGGCGCRIEDRTTDSNALWLLAAIPLLGVVARRHRHRRNTAQERQPRQTPC